MRLHRMPVPLALGLGLVLATLWLLRPVPLPPSRAAGPVTVTTTEDELNSDGDCSLREAIQAANSNAAVDGCAAGSGDDTIILPAGVYALTLAGAGESINQTGDLDITGNQGLTITGAGPQLTVMDGLGLDRVLDIASAVPRVVLSGVGIVGGNVASFGGGIESYAADLRLVDVVVGGNRGTRGGGIATVHAALTLIGTQVISNTATDYGGGVYTDEGLITLGSGQVISNSAPRGGGIAYWEGALLLTGGEILSNTASYGGGVYGAVSGLFTQTGASRICYNYASQDGGGVYVADGLATLAGGQVSGNRADLRGGGLFANLGGLVLDGGQVLTNAATYGGGAYLFLEGSVLTMTGASTIAHNTANNGGGIYVSSGDARLPGGTVISNTASNGAGLYVYWGSAELSGLQVVENLSASSGGGLYLHSGQAQLTAGQISGNDAGSNGGGVYISQAGAIFTQTGPSEIALNDAELCGGGIELFNGSAWIEGGRIVSNTADYCGGGIEVHAGTAALVRAQVVANQSAGVGGGGIYVEGGRLGVLNSTVSGNRASETGGGGMHTTAGETLLVFTSIVSNVASGGAGGIQRAGGAITVQNTLLAYNGLTNCLGTPHSLGYNLDDGSSCGLAGAGDLVATDPLLVPLTAKGGPGLGAGERTWLHPLLLGSAAIDAGSCRPGVTKIDQRGVSRPQGASGKCDIGAYEYVAYSARAPLLLRQ